MEQGRYIGLGYLGVRRTDGCATGHLATEGATIRMEPTGKINVYVNGGSIGNSIETTVVQLTADALGANIDDVATIQGDTAVTPYGAGTQGSRSRSHDSGRRATRRARCCASRLWRWPHTGSGVDEDDDRAWRFASIRAQ